MGTFYKALKVRVYPNKTQEVQILKTLGSCRFIYNQILNERIQIYEELKDDKEKLYSHKYKTVKEYRQEFQFLKEPDSQALAQSSIDLKELNLIGLERPKFKPVETKASDFQFESKSLVNEAGNNSASGWVIAQRGH